MKIEGNIKYVLIAILIVTVIFSMGGLLITTIDGFFHNKNIEYSDVVVTNKYLNNNDTEHYYVIVDEKGNIYDILNFTNNHKIYNYLQVGNKYKFVIQKPISSEEKYIHIIQVFNETN